MPAEPILINLSFIAAFIAGMVALFAPCCVTFLLPAYFANVFKEKKRILLMTFIYSLGIFTIMIPIVLGAKAISQLFFDFHDQSYLIGGAFLIFIGIMGLLNVKLPMPRLNTSRRPDDPVSTYILGIFSGITSACCAPVLIGALALSSLSPSLFTALLVGFFYVLGMVTPLYLVSLFIDKGNFLANPIFRKSYFEISLSGKKLPVTLSNLISFIMFVGLGILLIILSLTGRLAMTGAEESATRAIQNTAMSLTNFADRIPGIDAVFALLAAFLFYKLITKIFGR